MKFILNFSGGKDSTVLLHYCIKNNIRFDEIIYVKDFYEYPRKIYDHYFKYIEKYFNVKITKLYYNSEEKVIYNKMFPNSKVPYCKFIKASIINDYLKNKYPNKKICHIMGITRIESHKRNKYNIMMPYFWNKKLRTNHICYYPILDMKDSFKYLKENDIKINPLYDILDLNRLGCSICFNTRKQDLIKIKVKLPETFQDFINLEVKCNKEIQEITPLYLKGKNKGNSRRYSYIWKLNQKLTDVI